MIKDKNGVPLEFGDTVLNDYQRNIRIHERAYYRYCFEGFRRGRTGVFIDKDGRPIEFKVDKDGIIPHVEVTVPASDYELVLKGMWINGEVGGYKAMICSRCGSPIPIASSIDQLKVADNRNCYFCGARMEAQT